MPSTTSRVVSIDFASSTVITPSWPTLSIASAISSPIVLSLFAEIEPTCAISVLPVTSRDIAFKFSIIALTASSIPRFSAVGFEPAVTFFNPWANIAWARTVAVVVPSPATSLVFEATSFTIWAPIFSNGSSNSISLATVTPSFVTVGAPNFLSITTLRPLGPRVILTAWESTSIPRLRLASASELNLRIFAAIYSSNYYDYYFKLNSISKFIT